MDKDTTKLELAKIIEKKPNWIIRWGVTVFFLIVIFVFIIWYLGFANQTP